MEASAMAAASPSISCLPHRSPSRDSATPPARRCLHLAMSRAPLHASTFTESSILLSQSSWTRTFVANAVNKDQLGEESNSATTKEPEETSSLKSQSVQTAETAAQPTNDGFQFIQELFLQLMKGVSGQNDVAAKQLPEAKGDMKYMVGEPFFLYLYNLYLEHGSILRLNFGPKSFIIVSDPLIAKQVLRENSKAYSKGILAEILEFVMGTGLIPAEQEVWRVRRRAIVPALHLKYVAEMVEVFARTTEHLCDKLNIAANDGVEVELESFFSRLTLDIIGKAVFNYDFDSLSYDKGVAEAVYVALREAEYRSMALIPYWNIPIIKDLSPQQRKVRSALKLINGTLDELIGRSKKIAEEQDLSFGEDFVNEEDPSILQFLLASGEEVTNKQLRDDLMTMLIAGHETSAAVLTWAFYLLAKNPMVTAKLQEEVDSVLGDRLPTMADMKKLKLTRRVINETLRLYPEPPVLIRRALEDDELGGFPIKKGEDIFISVWNLHRSPQLWEKAEKFWPERWALDGPDPTEITENYRYLPFGGGPRKCVGDVFATYETITAVAMLVQRFNFELPRGAPPVGMVTGATIHTSDGLKMTVKNRVLSQETPYPPTPGLPVPCP